MQTVIQHLKDFLKNQLSSEYKAYLMMGWELLGLIEDYGQGLVPLIVSLT